MKTLEEKQKAMGAAGGLWRGKEAVFYYTSLTAENYAARNHVGLFHIGNSQDLYVYGKHAREILEYLGTDSLKNIQKGDSTSFVFCDSRGGIMSSTHLICLEKNSFLLIMRSCQIDQMEKWINIYKWGDCQVLNNEGALVHFVLSGKKTPDFLHSITNNIPQTRGQANRKCYIGGVDTTIICQSTVGETSYQIIADGRNASILWDVFIKEGAKFNLQPCGAITYDVLRMERGVPVTGREITNDYTPFDVGLAGSVDFSKEEFLGKEALLHRRFKPKRLTGFIIEGVQRAVISDSIYKKNEAVGKITSSGYSFVHEKSIALGILDYGKYHIGEELAIRGVDSYSGIIQAFPFTYGQFQV